MKGGEVRTGPLALFQDLALAFAVNRQIFRCKFAGGSPAAGHFLLCGQRESNQREGRPGSPPMLFARVALRCSTSPAVCATRAPSTRLLNDRA